jgi:hypothetical protein
MGMRQCIDATLKLQTALKDLMEVPYVGQGVPGASGQKMLLRDKRSIICNETIQGINVSSNV